jgi:hypothetical protein
MVRIDRTPQLGGPLSPFQLAQKTPPDRVPRLIRRPFPGWGKKSVPPRKLIKATWGVKDGR